MPLLNPVLLWLSVPASAVEWYLESAGQMDRAEAARVEGAAAAIGFDARVVRRFADGEGWLYLARVEGFADAASARVAARQLVDATGARLAILQAEGDRVEEVDVVGRQSGEPDPPEAEPVLARAAAAHGTGAHTRAALASSAVRLAYRRTLPDGRTVEHEWGSDGRGSLYAEVRPGRDADGLRASRTRIVDGRAELSVDGGPYTPRDPARARAAIEALGPEEILPLVLAVGAVLDERREFSRMVVHGEGRFDGEPTIALRFGGDATSGPIELEVGRDDHRIRRIAFDDGAVVREFRDYRAIAGTDGVLPRDLLTRRGGEVTDRIRIDAFEVGGELPRGWTAGD